MNQGNDNHKSNVTYRFSEDGKTGYGTLADGTTFLFDADLFYKIKDTKWYAVNKKDPNKPTYIYNKNGIPMHQVLFTPRKGMELDHINLDSLDNRRCNTRFCTHQQNQMNQPLQCNNTSGASGVCYYKARRKYIAAIKVSQQKIHLGYFINFEEAAQARNVAMECMFGEYGRYNDVPPAPQWIRQKVIEKCKRFANLSVSKEFYNLYGNMEVQYVS